VVIRTTGGAAKFAAAARAAGRAADPDQPVLGMKTFDRRIAGHLLGVQSALAMMGIFSGLALAWPVLPFTR
jgi:hypothetical protein